MMDSLDKFILNPSFIIPVLYSSIVLNIILLIILARIIGPLRKALNTLYVINSPLSEVKKSCQKDQKEDSKDKDNNTRHDKQPINTPELF